MADKSDLVNVARTLDLPLHTDNAKEMRGLIVERVRDLILYDLNRLTSILYRIDVSEKKLKMALDHLQEADSAEVITDLILERQAEKTASRMSNEFRGDENIPGEEKW